MARRQLTVIHLIIEPSTGIDKTAVSLLVVVRDPFAICQLVNILIVLDSSWFHSR